MNDTKVSIDLAEYKEFIISQYESGKLKESYASQLKRQVEEMKQQDEILTKMFAKQDMIIELAFKRSQMGNDTRQEQTNIHSDYFGYSKKDYQILIELGFKETYLKEYVNEAWNEREEKEKIEAELEAERVEAERIAEEKNDNETVEDSK